MSIKSFAVMVVGMLVCARAAQGQSERRRRRGSARKRRRRRYASADRTRRHAPAAGSACRACSERGASKRERGRVSRSIDRARSSGAPRACGHTRSRSIKERRRLTVLRHRAGLAARCSSGRGLQFWGVESRPKRGGWASAAFCAVCRTDHDALRTHAHDRRKYTPHSPRAPAAAASRRLAAPGGGERSPWPPPDRQVRRAPPPREASKHQMRGTVKNAPRGRRRVLGVSGVRRARGAEVFWRE